MQTDIVRRRMDRFIEEALIAFSDWYLSPEARSWLGKERDCVNLFAMHYLAAKINPKAAIKQLGQIKVECAVPQPKNRKSYPRPSAPKDLVIWNDPFGTTWSVGWHPTNYPRVVMEWKTIRSGHPPEEFDGHDLGWLEAFTNDAPSSLGYLVQVYCAKEPIVRCDGPKSRKARFLEQAFVPDVGSHSLISGRVFGRVRSVHAPF